MTVDDLFPEDGEGEDHPLMALFNDMDAQRNAFIDAISKALGCMPFAFVEPDGTVVAEYGGAVVDTPTPPSATVTG